MTHSQATVQRQVNVHDLHLPVFNILRTCTKKQIIPLLIHKQKYFPKLNFLVVSTNKRVIFKKQHDRRYCTFLFKSPNSRD
jgi:hypothetical protein